jgi:hypothetical protein
MALCILLDAMARQADRVNIARFPPELFHPCFLSIFLAIIGSLVGEHCRACAPALAPPGSRHINRIDD